MHSVDKLISLYRHYQCFCYCFCLHQLTIDKRQQQSAFEDDRVQHFCLCVCVIELLFALFVAAAVSSREQTKQQAKHFELLKQVKLAAN